MSSRWHLRPTLDIVEALCQGTRGNRDLRREDRYAGWHFDSSTKCFTLVGCLVVKTHGGVNGLGDPIDHDVGEQLIFREDTLNVPMTIAPGTELLDDPPCQAHW